MRTMGIPPALDGVVLVLDRPRDVTNVGGVVRANFQRLVPVLRAAGQRIAVIDGTASIDAVHAAVVAQVMDLKPLR